MKGFLGQLSKKFEQFKLKILQKPKMEKQKYSQINDFKWKEWLKKAGVVSLLTVSVLVGVNVSVASTNLQSMEQQHRLHIESSRLELRLACELEKEIAALKLKQVGDNQRKATNEEVLRWKFKRDDMECLGE